MAQPATSIFAIHPLLFQERGGLPAATPAHADEGDGLRKFLDFIQTVRNLLERNVYAPMNISAGEFAGGTYVYYCFHVDLLIR